MADAVRRIFDEAAPLSGEARRAALDRARAADPDAAAEAEALLAAHDRAGILDRDPAAALGSAGGDDALDAPGPSGPLPAGTRAGPYTLGRALHAGPLGVLHEADDDRGARAAVRVLTPGCGGPGALAALEALARAGAAAPPHPGLARPLGAGAVEHGTPRERLYLAAELARGLPIAEHARARSLSVAERLALVAQACDAAAAALAAGVGPLKLTPAGVLVETPAGAEPRARVVGLDLAALLDLRTPHPDPRTPNGAARALAALAYELVAGQPPDPDRPEPPSALNRACPRPIDRALLRALSGEPATPETLAAALRDAAGGGRRLTAWTRLLLGG